MTDIVVLNSKFEAAGKIKSSVDLSPDTINIPVVHQVVKALLAGKRQGTACTKTRSEVSGSSRKPYKQKGTGRARQGDVKSPLLVGGGSTFGPHPRSYDQKINKKVMLGAIRSVLADKLQAGKLTVVDTISSNGKTKDMYALLSGKALLPALVVVESSDSKALLATRNLKVGAGIPVKAFSVYEALKYENLVIEKKAFEVLVGKLV